MNQSNKRFSKIKQKNQLAFQLIEEEKVEEAFELLEQNYRESPSMQTICNLAYYYLFVGVIGEEDRRWIQPEKAIEILRDFKKPSGDYFIPCSMLGHAYYQINQYKEAKECFEKAYACDKKKGIVNYSYLLYLTGDMHKAAEGFLTAYKKDKDRYFMYYAHLFCTLLVGTDEEMLEKVKKLHRKTDSIPIDELCELEVANLFFLLKDYVTFINIYDAVWDDFYISPSDFHKIAHALHQLDRDDEIKVYYDKVYNDYAEDYDTPEYEEIEKLKEIYMKEVFLKEPELKLYFRLEKHDYTFV